MERPSSQQQSLKHTLKGVELLRLLANEGYRVFSLSEARRVASQVDLQSTSVVEVLTILKRRGWIAQGNCMKI